MNKQVRNLLLILGGIIAFQWIVAGKNPFKKDKNAVEQKKSIVNH